MRKALLLLLLLMMGWFHYPKTGAQDDPFPITIVDATGHEVTIESIDSIASGSGDITEIIVELGFRENLVGIDLSSTYPPDLADEVSNIGFARRLALEPIIAVNPSVFFCTETCAPTVVLDQLRDLRVPVVIIPDNTDTDIELPLRKIDMVAEALGVPEKGIELSQRVWNEIEWARTAASNVTERPYVLMMYLRGTSLQLIAGKDTPSQVMIENAGAIDAAVDVGVVGYTPLNPELLLTAFPDYILFMEGGLEGAGGLDTVRNIQGITQTPAGENENYLIFDDQYLLGMSTRTGQALMDLVQALHPSVTWENKVSYPYTIIDATETEVTIQAAMPLATTNDSLYNLVQQLGYHPVSLESATYIIAAISDNWAELRENALTVVVVEDRIDIAEVAQALGVSGRGAALIYRQSQE